MDATSQRLLRDALVAEQVSFLQYVAQAQLWVPPPQRPIWARIVELAQQQAERRRQVETQLAQAHLAIPPTNSFPAEFTNYNYAALQAVLPVLVRSLQNELARLESTLARLSDPAARAYLEPLVAHKRQTLATIQGLQP